MVGPLEYKGILACILGIEDGILVFEAIVQVVHELASWVSGSGELAEVEEERHEQMGDPHFMMIRQR